MKDDRLYLINILECIEKINEYTKDGKDSFFFSSLIQDGVIRNFEIIGEASKRLSDQLKENSSDIPWKQISGFRDFLIHQYNRIDLNEVWLVVEKNLPDLYRYIKDQLDKTE